MPQPTAPRPSPTADRPGPEPEATTPAKAPDLTVNKVIAGAGAAVTSAVLGSYFGATGTVAGAALGSVASTVATTFYQRSLDRTRDTILARVRLSPGSRTDLSDTPTVQLTVPQQRGPAEPATTQLHVEPVLRRPRKVWLWAGATVLVFVIGLLVVTGLEWAKGASLTTGQPGTSVGRVLTPPAGGNEDRERSETTSQQPTPSAEPTTEPAPTDEATSSAEPSPTDERRSDPEATRERSSGSATPQPTSDLLVPGLREND
ncbi:hypothetical protein FHX44_113859 [Pseudonocardia hierapolitana]|uniref:Uncharacterized protein n=1 Tax=Pseudonocardia hierapolitana TaxID=1128676 RepID=A0A561SSU9_9PSEU|nr:hypothetical protein [Pseudonocardia hierapolitana]TWF77943.1 hypothetical protein FHX44_113859 [Pseudonocardia hierapolitana]